MRNSLVSTTVVGCIIGVFSSVIQADGETPITGIHRTEGGKMSFSIPSDPGVYHVLRRSWRLPSSRLPDRPVAVVRGVDGEVTITDSVLPKGQGFYRIETYPNSSLSDLDGDGERDFSEFSSRVIQNPINPAPWIDIEHGSVMLKSRALFEQLSNRDNRPGATSVREVKFLVFDVHTDSPELYFADSNRYAFHLHFTQQAAGRYLNGGFNNDTYFNNSSRKNLAGSLISHDNYVGVDGSKGIYTVEFWPTDPVAFRFVEKAYELIAASMPYVDGNIAYHPASETQRQQLLSGDEEAELAESHVRVIHTEELFANVVYSGLNPAESYGRLRLITGAETLSIRDIVIFRNIPNDLTHVAGIMTEIPQTPLSHINLKAKQNNTPNAYIKDASSHPDIAPLLGQNVYYKVGPDGFEIRAASQEEVEAHFESIRPARPQYPVRDLSVKEITPLSGVQFADSDAFGAKASNVAELRRILPSNTPDGYAVPFYFYDEFMKYNGFYEMAAAMVADSLFQSVPEIRENRLRGFRKSIKDGALPPWMADALEDMRQSVGGTPRARSSTNNEDLEGFNGAGLYSSYTHYVHEGHFQKTAKQVWASLWNYRAYEERDFWRIDHFTAAMGILVHPNYSNERANGVGVTANIFDPTRNGHYINVQVGESLVTNPDADVIPEEYLIAALSGPNGDEIQYIRFSNLVPEGETVLTPDQVHDLRAKMRSLHDHFKGKYNGQGNTWAMEVEFKITSRGQLVIKQARPWLN